ncbi:MAG: rhombosortase [Gammaproteobacteria bacterium]|nr:rhombosortase [Gammaproteobacteria bacterium]
MLVALRTLSGVALFVVVLCVLQVFAAALEYERQQILAGQVWRLWTGHFVHSHATHLALNAMAAVALYVVFLDSIKALDLLRYGLVFSVLISLALLYFYPDLAWYNGLSGVLHALVSLICLRCACLYQRWYALGLIAVWGKVLWEVWRAQAGYQAELEGVRVIVQAHLIGVVLGTFVAVLTVWSSRSTSTAR